MLFAERPAASARHTGAIRLNAAEECAWESAAQAKAVALTKAITASRHNSFLTIFMPNLLVKITAAASPAAWTSNRAK